MVNVRPYDRRISSTGRRVSIAPLTSRAIVVLLFGIGAVIGCSPLDPIPEPEVSDLQLAADTLRASLRDAQRTITELRAEVESRRQELADVQIARAQLEGRLREAERRLVEARHVIDLQREELAGSRSERERIAKTGMLLRSQMKQLQLQLSKISGKPTNEPTMAQAKPVTVKGHRSGVPPVKLDPPVLFDEGVQVPAEPVFHPREGSSVHSPIRVSVKPGDTLWSIAQRYRVPVKRLMALNQLSDNYIQVGQSLWLVEPPQ